MLHCLARLPLWSHAPAELSSPATAACRDTLIGSAMTKVSCGAGCDALLLCCCCCGPEGCCSQRRWQPFTLVVSMARRASQAARASAQTLASPSSPTPRSSSWTSPRPVRVFPSLLLPWPANVAAHQGSWWMPPQAWTTNCPPLPPSGLDSYTSNEVMTVVKALVADGTTICATIVGGLWVALMSAAATPLCPALHESAPCAAALTRPMLALRSTPPPPTASRSSIA